MENPIKMDDLGVPLFLETPISVFVHKSFPLKEDPLSILCFGLFSAAFDLVSVRVYSLQI